MDCLANIICCGSAMLAAAIAGVATLCSNCKIDGRRRRNDKVCNCFKKTAAAIARAAGYNYLKLRVYSNPNFGSEGWDTDSASDDDDDDDDEDGDGRPSTSSAAQKRGHIPIREGGVLGNAQHQRSQTW